MFPNVEFLALGAIPVVWWLCRGRDYAGPRALSRAASLLITARPAVQNWYRGLSVFLWTIGLAASATIVHGVHVPNSPDEFGYLYQAETFCLGRCTNPQHPFWQHFERIHMLQEPTAASKYPPAQGLALAAGQGLCGHPIAGVWLSLGLAMVGLWWMLQAWVPSRWAVVGSAVAACHLAPSGWGQSYWGGAVACLGGALVCGAIPRLTRRARWQDGVWLGVGMALLANSRPFEGAWLSLAALVWWGLAVWKLRRAALGSTEFAPVTPIRILLATSAAGVILLPTAFAMAYYNQCVTGEWWRLPYQQHDRLYAANPTFLCQPPGPIPEYRHKQMRAYYVNYERNRFLRKHSYWGFNKSALTKVSRFVLHNLGPISLLPCLALFFVRPSQRVLIACGGCLWGLLGSTQSLYFMPHYLAPLTGCLSLLTVEGLRRLRVWRRGEPWSGRGLLTACLATSLAGVCGMLLTYAQFGPQGQTPPDCLRAEMEQKPGKHLVIISFDSAACRAAAHQEWMPNHADLDNSPVVWARSISPEADGRLRRYFADRQAWRVRVTAPLPEELEYHVSPETASPEGDSKTKPPVMANGASDAGLRR